jgi:hypothetical protein
MHRLKKDLAHAGSFQSVFAPGVVRELSGVRTLFISAGNALSCPRDDAAGERIPGGRGFAYLTRPPFQSKDPNLHWSRASC